ncbi:hypothetical protein D3C83_242230 [compost metagenome]
MPERNVEKKSIPAKSTGRAGADEPGPGSMSLMSTVLAAVPLVRQSSRPVSGWNARK